MTRSVEEMSLEQYERIKPALDAEFGPLLHTLHDYYCHVRDTGRCNCNLSVRMERAQELLSDDLVSKTGEQR